jgi:hypothetical protein
MLFGSTLSPHYAHELGLDPLQLIHEAAQMGLRLIRLGAYWNQIEIHRGEYDYRELDAHMDICGRLGLQVIFTIGAKAPRWPEFYIPPFYDRKNQRVYEDALSAYITATIGRYKNHPSIIIYQIENEPLDPSGPQGEVISHSLLQNEIDHIKQCDPHKKIMVTFWANDLIKRHAHTSPLHQVDIVGLDLYAKVPHQNRWGGHSFRGITGDIQTLQKHALRFGTSLCIAELQAEPWEPNIIRPDLDAKLRGFTHADISPHYKTCMGVDPTFVLLWGMEWWYAAARGGNATWIERVRALIQTHQVSHK